MLHGFFFWHGVSDPYVVASERAPLPMPKRMTAADAKAWADFYINVAKLNPSNPSAAGRAQLMQKAYELLKDNGN